MFRNAFELFEAVEVEVKMDISEKCPISTRFKISRGQVKVFEIF